MKIFIAQQNYHIGNIEGNVAKIKSAIQEAKARGGDLIVFSELSICGYPPRDFLEFEDFIDQCLEGVEEIRKVADTIGVIIGAPARNPVVEGKDLFNAAYLLYENKIHGVAHKTLLPTYDIFDEYRYFEPAFDWNVIEFKSLRIALTICEDIWNLEDNPLYRFAPMERLILQSPDLMINLSASPFDYVHAQSRQYMIKRNVLQYKLPMVYCNGVGSQTEVVFDGGSVVMDVAGNIVTELPYFKEALEEVNFSREHGFQEAIRTKASDVPDSQEIPLTLEADYNIHLIHAALLSGIRDYFSKMGFKKAIVASSGGVDSALVLALACEALGSENVHALLMPSQYSTSHSVSDAEELSKKLGNPYDIIPIKSLFDEMDRMLDPIFGTLPFNVAEENMQSRIRGALVMALANKFNYILLNTSNKSELAVGYGTLYGDMAGGLGVLGDLYKVQVYALCRYINRIEEIIPNNILTKPPSAELRPDQKDSDSLPPYELMDPMLYQYIERRQGPKELIAMGNEATMVSRILKLTNTAEYKRAQFCPIIRVSPKAFGMGRRLPIVGKYLV